MSPRKSTFAAAMALACTVHIAKAQESAPAQGLPLQRISLFSSGVGYFERGGTVDNSADITLYFQRDGLNDVLKSLIIIDPSGQLRPATYSLPELLHRSQENTLTLPADQTLGGILRHFQGAQIAITADGKTTEGRLLSIATKTETDEKGNKTAVDIASIFTPDGLQIVRLDALQNGGKVLLRDAALNKKLANQLTQSATDLARSVDDSYVPVTLHFDGKGKRTVHAGYIQGTSVWKTSYRLAFDAPKAKAKSTFVHPLLQGWAIAENTTNEDWDNVSLNLIAGTPVSFTMNMSAPLYVHRNDEPVPFGHTLASQIYSENMDAATSQKGISDIVKIDAQNALTMEGAAGPRGQRGPQGPQGAFGIAPPAAVQERQRQIQAAMSQQQASASGDERGAFFAYAIDQPISLKRGEAANIPIISQTVEAEKLSIFDTRQSQNTLHAVNGLSLKNTTNLYLAGGPLTIYEDDTYAGDAQITDIAPGENRLISYSLDGDLVISQKPTSTNSAILSMAIKKGVLTITRKEQQTRAYEFHNKANADKSVLILSPIVSGYELVKPEKPDSKSKKEYRFKVTVPAQKNADFEAISERTFSQTAALLNTNIDSLLVYSREKEISPQVKNALTEIIKRRNAIDEIRVKQEDLERQLKDFNADQSRIRSNMNSLPRDSDLYKSYMAKLAKQESEIETVQAQIKSATQDYVAAQQTLSEYVQGLDIS